VSIAWAGAARRSRAASVWLVAGLLIAALIVAMMSSLFTGAVAISPSQVVTAIFAPSEAGARDAAILWAVRLPRTFMAMLVGACLGVSGAVMQGLFRNPLADPGLIGVSSGATLAAVSTIVLGQNMFGMDATRFLPITAFIGGLAVTLLLYAVATRDGRTSVSVMLLGGIAVGALAMAVTGLLIFIASEQQLRELTFWSLGSLAGANWVKLGSITLCVLIACAALPLLMKTLDRLALGEAEARYMGVNVELSKAAAIGVTSLLTGAAVAVSGTIGFIGLVVPHLLRISVSPSHRFLLPLSALLGALLMLVADQIARRVAAPAELPIGIVTAMIGGPVFMWILLKSAPDRV